MKKEIIVHEKKKQPRAAKNALFRQKKAKKKAIFLKKQEAKFHEAVR